jgi:hypothetical protein
MLGADIVQTLRSQRTLKKKLKSSITALCTLQDFLNMLNLSEFFSSWTQEENREEKRRAGDIKRCRREGNDG